MFTKVRTHFHWMLQRYRFHVSESKRFTERFESTPEERQMGRDSEIQCYTELNPNVTEFGILLIIAFYKVQWKCEMAYYIITGLEPNAWVQHCEEMSRESDEELLSYAR